MLQYSPVAASRLILAIWLLGAHPLLANDTLPDLLSTLIRERQQISYGTVRFAIRHEIAHSFYQSYAGVTRHVESEFIVGQDLWRQVVLLSHPKWKRRTVSLVNDEGAFHDDGGASLYGSFSSSRDEIGSARPDVYDIRLLGLRFPQSDLAGSTDATSSAHLYWASRLGPLKTEHLSKNDGSPLFRYLATKGDGVEVAIVSDPEKGGNPTLITQRLDGNVIQVEVSYMLVEARRDSEHGGGLFMVWFPKNVVYTAILVGNEVGYREVIEIIECDFVKRPEVERFQISTLGLPRGRRVMGDGVNQMVIDDGLRRATGQDIMNPGESSYTIIEQTERADGDVDSGLNHNWTLIAINGIAGAGLISVLLWSRCPRRNS